MAKTSTLQSLKAAVGSWRLGAVSLLSLSSGLPFGLVITGVPAWMTMAGVDIKTVGVLTLAQAPYGFKFLWSPLIDRFGILRMGRKRGWIFLFQFLLAACTFGLAAQATSPEVGAVAALTLLIAFASASQDIAIDAYTVDSLNKEEQGLAVGARVAAYRVGMWIAGVIAISVAPLEIAGRPIGWGVTIGLQAIIYLALLPVTFFAPEPALQAAAPKTLREAVWDPFVGFFQKNRALEIAAFLLLYKLADNLAFALVRPFFLKMGFSGVDVGIASGTIGLVFTMLGTFVGGVLTSSLGVGRALWFFGIFQSCAGIGYAVVAQVVQVDPTWVPTGAVGAVAAPWIGLSDRVLMYFSMALEAGASGMGTGAFGVLLLRLTQKRFSATQYALFSSIFALGRTIAGPIAGGLVDAIGWRDFFLLTIPCGIPGLIMLARFVPWGTRELPESAEAEESKPVSGVAPVSKATLVVRGLIAAVIAAAFGLVANAALSGLKLVRDGKAFDLLGPLARSLSPTKPTEYLDGVGSLVFGLLVGFSVAAYLAARRGIASAAQKPGASANPTSGS